MRNIVLSADPGVTTGWSALNTSTRQVEAGQLDFGSFTEAVDVMAPTLEVIIAERYTVTAETLRKTRQTASLEVIGFLRYVAEREGIELVLQSPGDAKKFATDDRLRSCGWRQPSSLDHANDALRHLMLFLVKAKRMEIPR